MSYQGYGYAPYQYGPGRQDYSSMRHVPTPPNSSADTQQQQSARAYAQGAADYDFASRSSSTVQDVNSRVHIPQMGEPSRSSNQHGYSYQQEPSYRSTGAAMRNNSFGSAGINGMKAQNSNTFANATQQQRTDVQMNYQSNQVPLDIFDRPLSTGSRSRDAASAMTALSTSIPARNMGQSTSASSPSINQVPSYSQTPSNTQNTMYPGSNMNASGPVSRTSSTTPHNNSPQMRTATQAHAYRTSSTSNVSRQQQQRQFSSSQAQHAAMTSAPSPPTMYADQRTSSYNTAAQPTQASTHPMASSAISNTNIPAETPALPGFIDPTQIYNPYHLEYERKKSEKAALEARRREEAAQVEAEEEERMRELEAEEAQQRREAEAERKRQAAAEARRKKAEAALQQTTENGNAIPNTQAPAPTPRKKPGPKGPRKSMPAKTSKKKQAQPSTQDDINVQAGSGGGGGDMAAEMKKMMAQMQQLKTANPALFKQLLKDMGDDQQSTKPDSQQQAAPQNIYVSQAPAAAAIVPTDPPIYFTAPHEPLITDTDSAFDRGKFPAARRKRKSKVSKADEIPEPIDPALLNADEPQIINGDSALPDRGKFPAARRRTGPRGSKSYSGTDGVSSAINYPTRNPMAPQGEAVSISPHSQPPFAQAPASQIPASSKTPQTNEMPAPNAQPTPEPKPETKPEPKAKPTQGATIWPDEKRSALSQAASSYILSVPANQGKECSADIILSMIDQNPSYVMLCDMIEARGLTINKVAFARHLLKAVPDLSSSSSSSASPAPGPPANGSPSVTQSTPTPQPNVAPSTTDAKAPTPSLAHGPSPSGTPGPPQPRIPPIQTHPGIPPAPMPPQPAFPGLANQQPPQGFQPSSHVSGFIEAPLPLGGPQAKHGTVPGAPGATGAKLNPKLRVAAPPSHAPAPGSKEAMARKRTFAEIVDLAQLSDDEDDEPAPKEPRVEDTHMAEAPPVNGNNNTVGMPQGAPPPHLQPGAVSGPPNANANANEGSFMQFRMQNGNLVSKTERLRSRDDLVKPLNKAEALRKSYYDPKTIARDVLIAAGRHPTERPLNQHLIKLRDNFRVVDNKSDLHTFLWDIVDPGGPPRPEVPLAPVVCLPPKFPIGKRQGLLHKTSRDSSDNTPRPLTSTSSTSHSQSQLQHSPSHLRTVSNAADADATQSPRAATAVAAAGMSQTPNTSGTTSAAPRRRGRPPGAKNKNTTAKTAPRDVEVAIPGGGRTSNSYRVFRCQWEGCGAELHNLKTLERHVDRVHVPGHQHEAGDAVPCLWSGCETGSGAKRVVEGEDVRRQVFTSAEALRKHLASTHLSAVAWKMGEGPSLATGSDTDKHDTFLKDTDNRMITPRATTDGNAPTLILPAAYRSIQSFNKIHGNDSDRAKAMAVMRALKAKQVNIGTGLSRGGCTLMNAKRQETVAGDEGVFEIVEGEGGE